MEKQTKNIITRAWVENELRFYNTADLKFLSLNSGIILVACLLVALIPTIVFLVVDNGISWA